MEAKDILKMDWTYLPGKEWGKLPFDRVDNTEILRSAYKILEIDKYVEPEEVVRLNRRKLEIFIEQQYRRISRKLGVPYTELEGILKEENAPFYTLLDFYYGEAESIQLTIEIVCELKQTFLLPDLKE